MTENTENCPSAITKARVASSYVLFCPTNPKIFRLLSCKTKKKQQILTTDKLDPENCWNFLLEKQRKPLSNYQNSCLLIFCRPINQLILLALFAFICIVFKLLPNN